MVALFAAKDCLAPEMRQETEATSYQEAKTMTSEERLEDSRSDFYYGRDAWEGYFDAEREGTGFVLPDPDEIRQTMMDIRWLREQEFPEDFIEAVIRHRSPRIDLVRKVTGSRGPRKAYRLLRGFTP